jgi:hypothetical protein
VATFLVTFSAPVIYLPGHSKAQQLQALRVNAPTEEGARMHAIRTTQGEADVLSVAEVVDVPAVLAVETGAIW